MPPRTSKADAKAATKAATKEPQLSSASLFYFALGAVLLVLPFLIPDLLNGFVRSHIARATATIDIENDLHPGRFSFSSAGQYSAYPAMRPFHALYALAQLGGQHKDEDAVRQFVLNFAEADFTRDLELMYYGLVVGKHLGVVSKMHEERSHSVVLSMFHETGFRLNQHQPVSVIGTAYALRVLKLLGNLDEFKQTPKFEKAIEYVLSLKDTNSSGFAVASPQTDQISLVSTYHALQALYHAGSDVAEKIAPALEGVESYVYACQGQDGGFHRLPLKTVEDRYLSNSTATATSQALFILLAVQNLRGDYGFGGSLFGGLYRANSFLRSCITLSGLGTTAFSSDLELEGTSIFLDLVNNFSISYGIPRDVQGLLVAVGIASLVYGAFLVYSPQLDAESLALVHPIVKRAFAVLLVTSVAVKVNSSLGVVAHLVAAVYLATNLAHLQQNSDDDDMIVIAFANASLLWLFVFLLSYISPYVFTLPAVYVLIAVWPALSTGLAVIASINLIGNKAAVLLLRSGSQAWILGTMAVFSYLYGRGDFQYVTRILGTQGYFFAIFLSVPFAGLIVTIVSTIMSAKYGYAGTPLINKLNLKNTKLSVALSKARGK